MPPAIDPEFFRAVKRLLPQGFRATLEDCGTMIGVGVEDELGRMAIVCTPNDGESAEQTVDRILAFIGVRRALRGVTTH